jgi:hypothetical protein
MSGSGENELCRRPTLGHMGWNFLPDLTVEAPLEGPMYPSAKTARTSQFASLSYDHRCFWTRLAIHVHTHNGTTDLPPSM